MKIEFNILFVKYSDRKKKSNFVVDLGNLSSPLSVFFVSILSSAFGPHNVMNMELTLKLFTFLRSRPRLFTLEHKTWR